MKLQGKRFIVTGGTSGIGADVVRRLIGAEAHVAFCGLTQDGASELLAAADGTVASYFEAFDMTDLAAARAFAQNAIEQLGGLDGLVNNAGANFFRGVEQSTKDDLDCCFGLNFYPAWAMAQEVYSSFKATGGGMIVNITSIHAEKTSAGVFPYNASKAALVALTKSLALEWGKDNIRAVAIAPALIMTPLADDYLAQFEDPDAERDRLAKGHPVGHAGRPSDVASLVLYLLSGANTFISGNTILVDGAISIDL